MAVVFSVLIGYTLPLATIGAIEVKVNAEEFNKKPAPVFRAADKGETVIINHDRYEKVFELTARDREPLREEVEDG